MPPRKILSLAGWAIGIFALFVLAYLVNVNASVFICVNQNLHSLYPQPSTGELWENCIRLYRGFPFSFFR